MKQSRNEKRKVWLTSKIVELSFDALVKRHCFTHHLITNYHKKDVLASKCERLKIFLMKDYCFSRSGWAGGSQWAIMRARVPKTLTTWILATNLHAIKHDQE